MKLGTQELIIILIVVIIIFGPTQIPKLTKMFGKSVKSFKEGVEETEEDVEEEMYDKGGQYLAFGPYIAISVICYIVFYDFIHYIVSLYIGLF